MIPVLLTTAEISVLVQLLDLAVKAGGLAVAEAALVIQKKLDAHKAEHDKYNAEQLAKVAAEAQEKPK